jgi:hypothetical protein
MGFGINKKEERKSEQILFVSAPISSPDGEIETFDYFAGMAAELAMGLDERYPKVDLVLKVPHAATAKADQRKFVSEAVKKPHKYACIIISPVDRRDMLIPMKSWIDEYSADKIIMVDQGYTLQDYPKFLQFAVGRPPYIQADWKNGGEMAARSMHEALEKRSIGCPNIVFLSGNVGSEQRIDGFCEHMEKYQKAGKFVASTTNLIGEYTRKTAMEVFAEHLKSCIKAHHEINGIFATNDEMALGVREAFNKHRATYIETFGGEGKCILPVLIGFDGIKDVTLLIDNKDSSEILYDTVDVKLKEQIKKLVTLIEKVALNRVEVTKDDKYILQPCISYRRLRNIL